MGLHLRSSAPLLMTPKPELARLINGSDRDGNVLIPAETGCFVSRVRDADA